MLHFPESYYNWFLLISINAFSTDQDRITVFLATCKTENGAYWKALEIVNLGFLIYFQNQVSLEGIKRH